MPTVALTSVSAALAAPRACASRTASSSKLAFYQRCKTETHAIRLASRQVYRVEISRRGDARCGRAADSTASS